MNDKTLHEKLMTIAMDLSSDHCGTYEEDGVEKHDGFFLDNYLEDLAGNIDRIFDPGPDENQKTHNFLNGFELDPQQVARYLWACVCSAHGCSPTEDRFDGRAIIVIE